MSKFLMPLLIILSAVPGLALEKLDIVVFDLHAGTDVTENDARELSEVLRAELNETGGLRVVERSKANGMIEELGLRIDQMTKEEIIRTGERLAAGHLIIGAVTVLFEKYQVDIRIINAKTGDLKATTGIESSEFEILKDLIVLAADIDEAVWENVIDPAKIDQMADAEKWDIAQEMLNTYIEQNGKDQIAQDLQKKINNGPAEQFYILAQNAYDREDYTGGLDHINEALKLNPEKLDFRQLKKKIEDALEQEKKESESRSFYEFAQNAYREKKYSIALTQIDKALDLVPTNEQYIKFRKKIVTGKTKQAKRESASGPGVRLGGIGAYAEFNNSRNETIQDYFPEQIGAGLKFDFPVFSPLNVFTRITYIGLAGNEPERLPRGLKSMKLTQVNASLGLQLHKFLWSFLDIYGQAGVNYLYHHEQMADENIAVNLGVGGFGWELGVGAKAMLGDRFGILAEGIFTFNKLGEFAAEMGATRINVGIFIGLLKPVIW